jgi:hypothetical protein
LGFQEKKPKTTIKGAERIKIITNKTSRCMNIVTVYGTSEKGEGEGRGLR